MPKFAAEMARIELTLSSGGEPDRDQMRALADDLYKAGDAWKTVLTRMQLAGDFQSREYFKITQAMCERSGETLESTSVMMRWQADNMKAFANGLTPIPPPPGLNLDKLMQQQQDPTHTNPLAKMQSAQRIDSTPFTGDEPAFESEVVQSEYKALCQAHAATIKLGEAYGTFDPLGKLAYIDALEAIEERWDVFYSRFALMGALNPTFKQQVDAFLSSMGGIDAPTFRLLLREAHQIMRQDAEDERSASP